MKIKKLLVLLVGLSLAGAVFAAEFVPRTLTKQDGSKMTKEMEVPVYGGLVNSDGPYGTEGWDLRLSNWQSFNAYVVGDHLLQANLYWGLRGTEDYDFARDSPVWWSFHGNLLEYYEWLDPNTMLASVRRGMHFWSKEDAPSDNPKLAEAYGREVTCHDIKAMWDAQAAHPQSWNHGHRETYTFTCLGDFFLEIKTTKVDFPMSNHAIRFTIGNGGPMMPAEIWELVEGGEIDLEDWKNALYMGPFIPSKWQEGLATTYKRNPNYYEHDPFFPENRLPYLDFWQYIVFNDITAKIAALRTHKLDILNMDVQAVPWQDKGSLEQTNPEIQSRKSSPTTYWMHIRMDHPESTSPWVNKIVRYAAMLAIDHCSVARDFYQGNSNDDCAAGDYMTYEQWDPLYISREELKKVRPDLAELYEYKPEKAKQLLAEAGYPNGFDTTIHSHVEMQGWVELMQGYLQNVGIRAEIKIVEETVLRNMFNSVDPALMVIATHGGTPEWGPMEMVSAWAHPKQHMQPLHGKYPEYKDDRLEQLYDELAAVNTFEEYVPKWKELTLHVMDTMISLNVPDEFQFRMWQPWVRGYHGTNQPLEDRFHKYVWIDAAQKTELSGRNANE